MTEDLQVTSGVPEYNGNGPSEKPQLQVIDIIDQMTNSVPYENAELNPDPLLTPADPKGDDHLVESTTCGVSGKEKEHQGLCEESYALEGTKHKERNSQQLWEEKAYSTNEAEEDQGEIQLHEHDQIETERYLEVNENATAEDFDGAAEVMKNENNGESHKKGQETNSKEFLPIDSRSNSQMEKPNEQPGSMKKSDISRHTYSRYNTISYRKIRKGNTKQRIDEFESMMHS